MKFINIPQNSYELGWRFDWPANLLESVDLKLSLETFVSHCSHRRSVTSAECFRMIDNDLLDCFIETLEETYIRPVRLS